MDQHLIETAVAAILGALTKSAAEPALKAGAQAWTWLKAKLTGPTLATAHDLETNPTTPFAPEELALLLKKHLHQNPTAETELRHLLEPALQSITQTANTTGDANTTYQIAGNQNRINAP